MYSVRRLAVRIERQMKVRERQIRLRVRPLKLLRQTIGFYIILGRGASSNLSATLALRATFEFPGGPDQNESSLSCDRSVGDPPNTIASEPTVADGQSFDPALRRTLVSERQAHVTSGMGVVPDALLW